MMHISSAVACYWDPRTEISNILGSGWTKVQSLDPGAFAGPAGAAQIQCKQTKYWYFYNWIFETFLINYNLLNNFLLNFVNDKFRNFENWKKTTTSKPEGFPKVCSDEAKYWKRKFSSPNQYIKTHSHIQLWKKPVIFQWQWVSKYFQILWGKL